MNRFILFVVAIIGLTALHLTSCINDTGTSNKAEGQEQAIYDSLLAQKLGADEYGMKSYVMAFLKAGPDRSQDSAEASRIQRAHLDNINRMAEKGMLVLAGPFLDNGELRGIYLFNTASVEEAEKLTSTDPAVQAGRLVMELHPWYGSAALPELTGIHERISLKSP